MTPQIFDSPISDLGFEPGLASTKNYPDGFVTEDQIDQERKINLEIIECNGGVGWKNRQRK